MKTLIRSALLALLALAAGANPGWAAYVCTSEQSVPDIGWSLYVWTNRMPTTDSSKERTWAVVMENTIFGQKELGKYAVELNYLESLPPQIEALGENGKFHLIFDSKTGAGSFQATLDDGRTIRAKVRCTQENDPV